MPQCLQSATVGLGAFAGLGGGAVARDATPAGGGETLTIYSSLPLQGDSRPQSADIARAIRMALRDNGGRAGRHRITYISLDDASGAAHGFWDPARVAVNARRAAGPWAAGSSSIG